MKTIAPCDSTDCVHYQTWQYNGVMKYHTQNHNLFPKLIKFHDKGDYFTFTPVFICPMCSLFKKPNLYVKKDDI
jgi:hypothetical protein